MILFLSASLYAEQRESLLFRARQNSSFGKHELTDA
jgi:hypothetical protein